MATQPLTQSVSQMLSEGIKFLDSLTDADYSDKNPEVYNASIGGHYRHVIDHVVVLLAGLADQRVNYDKRQRDEGVENDRILARAKTQELLDVWNELKESQMADVIDVIGKVTYGGGDASSCVQSTLGREAMYVVIHGVHHFALIGVICNLRGIPMPEGFGIAPSTVEHQKKLSAAK